MLVKQRLLVQWALKNRSRDLHILNHLVVVACPDLLNLVAGLAVLTATNIHIRRSPCQAAVPPIDINLLVIKLITTKVVMTNPKRQKLKAKARNVILKVKIKTILLPRVNPLRRQMMLTTISLPRRAVSHISLQKLLTYLIVGKLLHKRRRNHLLIPRQKRNLSQRRVGLLNPLINLLIKENPINL